MKRCKSAIVGVLLLLPICGCQLPGRLSLKPAIRFGTTKLSILSTVLTPAEYLALQARLEKLYDGPVLFDPGLTPNAIAGHLAAGRFQFAILSATEYAGIHDVSGLELVAAGIAENGAAMQKALIVASAKSNLSTLADVKGKRFAFGPNKDVLLDLAAHTALDSAGVTDKDIQGEVPLPPLFAMRIHLASGMDVAKTVAFDGGVSAGAVDEDSFRKLPETGGSFLTGPSKDMFRKIGETSAVPGLVIVSGPKTDPAMVQKLKAFMTDGVKPDKEPEICKQMKISGFGEPDKAAYEAARQLLPKS